MTVKEIIKILSKKVKKKIKDFILDEYGGNLVEYALLIGFALFIFFLLVSIVLSMMDWTAGQSSEFFEVVEGLDD
jgi:Flp pilus assembly pilin Flp